MTEKRANLFVFFVLTIATGVFGFWGWILVLNPQSAVEYLEPLYRTFLAFTGDSIYLSDDGTAPDWRLNMARLTGLGATISALFGLALIFVGGKSKRLWAVVLRQRNVVIGASNFAVDFATHRGRTVVFDTADVFETIDADVRRSGGLWLTDRMGKNVATGWVLWRSPQRVIFGSSDTVTNVDRAQVWLQAITPSVANRTEIFLRTEDNSVARDIALLSGAFQRVKFISRSETVARALVTAMAPTQLALLRGQACVHIVLIGLSSTNLAVAEELVLRCHHPIQEPLRLTVLDNQVLQAKSRLRKQRPDLFNPEFFEFGPFIDFVEMDAMECSDISNEGFLKAIEVKDPATAIVVAAGEGTRNLAITMRLRKFQMESLLLKAPIFMHSDSRTSIAPSPLEDLTGGVVSFGGQLLDAEDMELEDFYQSRAKAIHDGWRDSLGSQKGPENAWENMTTKEKRASYRAAMSSVEMFYAAGLIPPSGEVVAGLRAHPETVERILKDTATIDELWKTEHCRWNAERRAEGYSGHKGKPRDNEKKLHPLIIPCEDLTEEQADKDRKNVRISLVDGRARARADPSSPCWRKVIRVGVMGPLLTSQQMFDRLEDQFRAAVADGVFPHMTDCELEILSANAPGFDRESVDRLLKVWRDLTGHHGRVVLFNVGFRPLVDKIAAEYLTRQQPQTQTPGGYADLLARLAQQEEDLRQAAKGHLREADMRPVGLSDTDLDSDRDQYFETVKTVQRHILNLSDVMIFETNGGQSSLTYGAWEAWDGPAERALRLS